jgi:hypothetical protein
MEGGDLLARSHGVGPGRVIMQRLCAVTRALATPAVRAGPAARPSCRLRVSSTWHLATDAGRRRACLVPKQADEGVRQVLIRLASPGFGVCITCTYGECV